MYYLRYNKKTGLLTGWDKDKARLPLVKGEAITEVSNKPQGDDYEAYNYKNDILAYIGKPTRPTRRNLAKELDSLAARVKAIEDVKPASV